MCRITSGLFLLQVQEYQSEWGLLYLSNVTWDWRRGGFEHRTFNMADEEDSCKKPNPAGNIQRGWWLDSKIVSIMKKILFGPTVKPDLNNFYNPLDTNVISIFFYFSLCPQSVWATNKYIWCKEFGLKLNILKVLWLENYCSDKSGLVLKVVKNEIKNVWTHKFSLLSNKSVC